MKNNKPVVLVVFFQKAFGNPAPIGWLHVCAVQSTVFRPGEGQIFFVNKPVSGKFSRRIGSIYAQSMPPRIVRQTWA